ncbi:DUF86 domain-containing protein [candidate division WOR-3 bacterium]|nr:DUF86 domain-containing protein [candidate division WOR-3 bacterium]
MKSDRTYLLHIRDAIERIEQYASHGHEAFLTEHHWQDGIVRQLEIVGEATKHLSAEFRKAHPQVPWQRIAGLRDVLVHDYMGVDLNAVWDIVRNRVPELKFQVLAALGEPTSPS